MDRCGVRVPPEEGVAHQEAGEPEGQGRGGRGGPERPHLGVAVEHLHAVGRRLDIGGQVLSRVVPPHMDAAFPELARGDVDYAVVGGDVGGFAFAVKFGESIFVKVFHGVFAAGRLPRLMRATPGPHGPRRTTTVRLRAAVPSSTHYPSKLASAE